MRNTRTNQGWAAVMVAAILMMLAAAIAAPAQTYKTVHRFTGTDGANPAAGLVRDVAGNLYGTTFLGGTYGYGTVFKVDRKEHESVLHSFSGGADGVNPYFGALIMDAVGNL